MCVRVCVCVCVCARERESCDENVGETDGVGTRMLNSLMSKEMSIAYSVTRSLSQVLLELLIGAKKIFKGA